MFDLSISYNCLILYLFNFTGPSWNGNDDDLPPPPPINDDFPLPPPPADLPVSPPVTSPTTPSFVQSEKPKGFRSVARPTSKVKDVAKHFLLLLTPLNCP